MLEWFYLCILILNFVIFLLYGIDKFKARRRKWRISEATLIAPAFVFGAIGAMLGMIVFNHKISKTKFRILIPLAFVFNIICAVTIKKWLGV